MDLLRELGLHEIYVRVAAALVIGRMVWPGSEAQTYIWMMLDRSAILDCRAGAALCEHALPGR